MKAFTLIRLKQNGDASVHKVWVRSKQQALDLRWPDDSKVIGKFIVSGSLFLPTI
jgi:hypothetical protein